MNFIYHDDSSLHDTLTCAIGVAYPTQLPGGLNNTCVFGSVVAAVAVRTAAKKMAATRHFSYSPYIYTFVLINGCAWCMYENTYVTMMTHHGPEVPPMIITVLIYLEFLFV